MDNFHKKRPEHISQAEIDRRWDKLPKFLFQNLTKEKYIKHNYYKFGDLYYERSASMFLD